MAPFQTPGRLGSEGQIAVQGSRHSWNIQEDIVREQRHSVTWLGTTILRGHDRVISQSEQPTLAAPVRDALEQSIHIPNPFMFLGLEMWREMEKPALHLFLLLGNSRVRAFSCPNLTGSQLLLSKQGLFL